MILLFFTAGSWISATIFIPGFCWISRDHQATLGTIGAPIKGWSNGMNAAHIRFVLNHFSIAGILGLILISPIASWREGEIKGLQLKTPLRFHWRKKALFFLDFIGHDFMRLPNPGIISSTFALFLGTFSHSYADAAYAPDQSINNLNAAMEREANASNRYKAFAKKADEEGFPQVAKLFRAISKGESIHRRNHEAAIKQLGGTVAQFKLGPIHVRTTKENLKELIEKEKWEKSEMYPGFIKQARRDRASSAMEAFTYARDAELQHKVLLEQALKNLGKNKRMDYFVNTKTGSTVQRPPGSQAPVSEHPQGGYVKIE